MRLERSGDELQLQFSKGFCVTFGRNYVKASLPAKRVVISDRTKYSKRMVCIRADLDGRELSEFRPPKEKRLAVLELDTSSGKLVVILFPGAFRYDRAIISERYLCVEHSREEKVLSVGDSITILF